MVKSPIKDMEIPLVSVHDRMFEYMEKNADITAIIDATNDKTYTYREVLQHIRRVASGLARLGVRKGDIVSIISPSSPEFYFVFFGILANGASVTAANPAYTTYELRHHLQDSGARWLYTVPELVETVKKAAGSAGQLQGIICNGDAADTIPFSQLMSDDGSCFPQAVKINPREDVATIPYSSGTTGLPKGVMITHYNIVAALSQMDHEDVRRNLPEGAPRVWLIALPFYHAYAMIGLLVASAQLGATGVILPRFQPEPYLSAIEKYKVTFLPIVPPIAIFIAKSPLVSNYDLSSLQAVSCAAAPMAKDTEKEFISKVKTGELRQGYGMTETTLAITSCHFDKPMRPGSCGILLPNTEVQIVDVETRKVLGPRERGELWVRGPQIMKGYLNKPQETSDTIDSSGWLHTGDVGYYDEDGYLYIVDRLKELIKCKGFQVAPAELEALLLNHPSVADVGVIGVADDRAGEVPKAFIVRKPEAASLTEQQLIDYVAERLSDFKHLRGGVQFVSAVPKSPSGKILRKDLRAMEKKSRL